MVTILFMMINQINHRKQESNLLGGNFLMGHGVLAKCSIQFADDIPPQIIAEAEKLVQINKDEFDNIRKLENNEIIFETSGYNGIDYSTLNSIQKDLLQLAVKLNVTKAGAIIIQATEYDEVDNGFWFEFDSDTVCKNCQGRGFNMQDTISGSYDQVDCEECNGKGVKE